MSSYALCKWAKKKIFLIFYYIPGPAQQLERGLPKSRSSVMDEIFNFLKKSRVEESTLKELVVPALCNFGYKTIADLRDLERNDLNIEGQAR